MQENKSSTDSLFTKADHIDWKHQAGEGDYAIYVPYADARKLMDWLDDNFDSWNEETEHHKYFEHVKYKKDYKTGEITETVTKQNVFRCTLMTIKGDIKKIRTGMAPSTDIEPTKGGESDAFKRAGTKMGFGRDLYNYPEVRVELKKVGYKSYPGFCNAPAFTKITELFINGMYSKNDVLFIGLDGSLYPFEYGNVQTNKCLLKGAGGSKAGSKYTPGAMDKKKATPTEITLDHIKKNLYNKTGAMPSTHVEPVLNQWLDGDQTIHHDKYVSALHKQTGNIVWFELNDEQKKTFVNAIK